MNGLRGVYPGSFNPPTSAHIDIAKAALLAHGLDRVDLALSRIALAKERVTVPTFDHRVEVLQAIVAEHEWLGLLVTDAQLLVDIADGYDVLVMGADKWHQIQDTSFYNDNHAERDAAMSALPVLAVAPRPPLEVPAELLLDLPDGVGHISSSGARDGTRSWMHPHALAFDDETGAWTEPERYREGSDPKGV